DGCKRCLGGLSSGRTDPETFMIEFGCPSCGTTLRVKDELAGRTGKCPKCQAKTRVPDSARAVDTSKTVSPPPIPTATSISNQSSRLWLGAASGAIAAAALGAVVAVMVLKSGHAAKSSNAPPPSSLRPTAKETTSQVQPQSPAANAQPSAPADPVA